MITARNWSSQWIWRRPLPGGRARRPGSERRHRYRSRQRPEKMKPDETILYNYATEMYRDKAISDATFAAAVKQFGEKA